MYHKHNTFAFVLNVLPTGEKNHFVTLFTKELGMINAKAQSIRILDSKLRYAIQEYSYVEISLVKGKDLWRITNALPIHNLYFELKENSDIFMAIARIFTLVKRLLPEEGSESRIFSDLERLCENSKVIPYTKQNIETLEWLTVLRILCFLGYCQKEPFGNLCDNEISLSSEYLNLVSSYKDSAIYSINKALKASHL